MYILRPPPISTRLPDLLALPLWASAGAAAANTTATPDASTIIFLNILSPRYRVFERFVGLWFLFLVGEQPGQSTLMISPFCLVTDTVGRVASPDLGSRARKQGKSLSCAFTRGSRFSLQRPYHKPLSGVDASP
jgi:hypothetical protein